jgi:hypothetical protein
LSAASRRIRTFDPGNRMFPTPCTERGKCEAVRNKM